jgi:hypothetical protein
MRKIFVVLMIVASGCLKSNDASFLRLSNLSGLVNYSISANYAENAGSSTSDTVTIFHQNQSAADTLPISLKGFNTNEIFFRARGYTLSDRAHLSGFNFTIPCDVQIELNKPYKIKTDTSILFWNGYKTPVGYVTFDMTLTFTSIITSNGVRYANGIFSGDVYDNYSPEIWSIRNGNFTTVRLN